MLKHTTIPPGVSSELLEGLLDATEHLVIPPFLVGSKSRIYAAFSFWIGVLPPMPMFGLSLLYVQSQRVA
jgi:hypothetical protein